MLLSFRMLSYNFIIKVESIEELTDKREKEKVEKSIKIRKPRIKQIEIYNIHSNIS